MVETTEEYRARINQLKSSIENEPYMKNMRPDIAEGISKTGNRQADIEVKQDKLEDDFVAVQQDASSASPSGAEVAVARAGFNTLGERLDKEQQQVNAQLAQTEMQIGKNPASKGTIADGIHDDTVAVQALFDAITEKADQIAGYVYSGFSEQVKFPTGDYVISDSIAIDLAYPNIDFSNARFRKHPDATHDFYALDFTRIWNGTFNNLTLDGFKKHIKMYNDNYDSGHIKIDSLTLIGGDVGFNINCQSTKTTLTNFRSNNVKQPIIAEKGDKVSWLSGWWDAGVLDEKYQGMIEINGSCQFTIDDVLYVPRPQIFEPRTIFNVRLNQGSVYINNDLFGGEPGQLPLVGVFGGTETGRGNRVIIKSNLSFTSNSALVELYNIPNYVEIDAPMGSYEAVGDRRAIRFNADIRTHADALLQSDPYSKIIIKDGVNALGLSSAVSGELLRFLRGSNDTIFGVVTATNTNGAEVLFDSKRNNKNAFTFRRGSIYKISISNRSNPNVDHYSEYLVQANHAGDNASIKPIMEGTGVVAPKLINDNGILKIVTNGSSTENRYYYKVEIADVPIFPYST